MGKELEYKLAVTDEEMLSNILSDAHIAALSTGTFQQTRMKTTYFDTPDRRFSAQRFTLRRRYENDESVVCLKTPLKESHARGEWQIHAERIDDSTIARLLEQGAPTELFALYAGRSIIPVCGAEFLRKHVVLQFPDGSRAELAGDHGTLHGENEVLHFIELELELLEGDKDEMLALVSYLCSKYSLQEQPLSKYARARQLK